MDKLYFESHEEFFAKIGDSYLHPTSCGDNIYSTSVEEMYQHFKARLVEELMVKSPELLEPAELIDTRPVD